VLDVTTPGVDDPEMERLVSEKVNAFWKSIESGTEKRGQISVTFSERRQKKSWFYIGEEDIPWEQWIINVEVRQPKSDRDRQIFNTTLAETLSKSLSTMLTYTSSERGRMAVPVITSASGISPFPVKVAVHVGGVEVG